MFEAVGSGHCHSVTTRVVQHVRALQDAHIQGGHVRVPRKLSLALNTSQPPPPPPPHTHTTGTCRKQITEVTRLGVNPRG